MFEAIFGTLAINTILNILALLTALMTLVTTYIIFLKTKRNTVSIQEVHILVNQQKTDLESYQRTLIHALKAQNIDVPENPNPR